MTHALHTDAFRDYERTTDAQRAEPWQLDVLRAWPWPAEARPTVETYLEMRAALDTADSPDKSGERPRPGRL